VAVAPVVGAWTPRAHGAREGRVRGFGGGAPLMNKLIEYRVAYVELLLAKHI
jgi:hypothetical protein